MVSSLHNDGTEFLLHGSFDEFDAEIWVLVVKRSRGAEKIGQQLMIQYRNNENTDDWIWIIGGVEVIHFLAAYPEPKHHDPRYIW